MSLEERFNQLVTIVQSLPKDGELKLSDNDKLKFYGFYKQATVGPINIEQPSFYKFVEKAKWNAWNENKALNKDQAMQGYIDQMKEVNIFFPIHKIDIRN